MLYHILLIFHLPLLVLSLNASASVCDNTASHNEDYSGYFNGMKRIYSRTSEDGTCVPVHRQCGWPKQNPHIPQYVLVIGLEGSGHHFWTDLPLHDCVWVRLCMFLTSHLIGSHQVNARHYRRDIGDGVPRRTPHEFKTGLQEQMALMVKEQGAACRRIVDSEDSFPTGAIRAPGRLFMHPDLINVHHVDGDVVNAKYLVVVRNTTDTVLSAMRRDFVPSLNMGVHIAEHTMIHVEAALRGISCHKIFIAHYEHILSRPMDFFHPLSAFLEFNSQQKQAFKSRLQKLSDHARMPSRKVHSLVQYKECKEASLGVQECYRKVENKIDRFLRERSFMWPTFAANAFDLADIREK